MRRREFIAGLGGAAAWPLVARAQSREPMRRIGILSPLAENDPEGQARFGLCAGSPTIGLDFRQKCPHRLSLGQQ